jgi:hypothetical protein
MTRNPRPVAGDRCDACDLELAGPYDFAHGGERSQVVCFDCEPPLLLCPACAATHAVHRDAFAPPPDPPASRM